jgi:hypothetical protein
MLRFNRRQSIFVASSILFSRIESAAADSVSTKYLGADYLHAFELQSFAANASRESDPNAVETFDESLVIFVEQGFSVRRQAVSHARNSELFSDPKKAISALNASIGDPVGKNYSLNAESIKSQVDAFLFVWSEGVPLVPDSKDILPIGIVAVEPVEKKNEETDLSMILDIALQTIGIFDGKQLAEEFLKDQDCLAILHEIAPSAKDSDWQKILHLSERFFSC